MRFKITPYIFISLACFLSAFSTVLWAEDISVAVKLSNIKAEKTVEKGGDEVYVDVTDYSSSGRTENKRIPVNPSHWLSDHLEKVQNVTLWQGNVREKEEIKLIFSVMDQEYPPWVSDELIGGAELILKNEKGKLSAEWKVPQFENEPTIEMKPAGNSVKAGNSGDSGDSGNSRSYIFKGEGALYDVTFSVEKNQK